MGRKLKEGLKINMIVKKSVGDKLLQYSSNTGIPRTVIVEKALELYLKDRYMEKDVICEAVVNNSSSLQ